MVQSRTADLRKISTRFIFIQPFIDEDRFWLNHLHTVPLNQIKASRQKTISIAGRGYCIDYCPKNKTGNLMAILQIDDGLKRLDLVIFSELFQQTKDLLAIDQTVIVEGEASIDAYNDQLRINAKKYYSDQKLC